LSTRKPDPFKNSTTNAIVEASSWFDRCNWEGKLLSQIWEPSQAWVRSHSSWTLPFFWD